MSIISNTCRIRFFTREFVFFRKDIVGKLKRNCIVNPRTHDDDEGYDDDEDENVTEQEERNSPPKEKNSGERLIDHAVQTVLDQGHLCPLPLVSAPVFWQYDHALRLYPTPDALILRGSRVNQFNRICVGCDVMNPGSFALDFSFVVYTPVEVLVSDDNMEVRSNIEPSRID